MPTPSRPGGQDETTATGAVKPFSDEYPFPDDIHGEILLNEMERDVVDTPEFQRLFRILQLGFIDLAFQTADHTRGAHSIGTCHLAKRLTTFAQTNTARLAAAAKRAGKEREVHKISHSEQVLISLGALVHDISHGPFSHEIEKKTHWIWPNGTRQKVRSYYGPYPKHDDYDTNPALYMTLLNRDASVLARVLARYSQRFWVLMKSEADPHIVQFVKTAKKANWPNIDHEILPVLLFHLLVFEKPEDAIGAQKHMVDLRTSFSTDRLTLWGLGPDPASWKRLHDAWYQPYRHDIIGDTLSADLIDYLLRDCRRLGIDRAPDFHVLNSYVLVPYPGDAHLAPGQPRLPLIDAPTLTDARHYRCAIDLTDYKRGSVRVERMNEVFRILDLRNEIHEKAVYHRVVQSALAMMCRAVLMLDEEHRPSPEWFYGFQQRTPALSGDDAFLQKLVDAAAGATADGQNGAIVAAQSIAQKLAERRVYRPLVVIPGEKVPALLDGVGGRGQDRESLLREFAAVVDSPYYSRFFLLTSWCIEKFLEHAFSTEHALEEFVLKTCKNDGLLTWARNLIPKRVIFWATPYKQLYKDPAILISIDSQVCTIEDLAHQEPPSSLASRARAGIHDSETKYENLWKLYVFISDGLYHTGVLAKLLGDHACAAKRENHLQHLQTGQRVAVRVLRAAWDHWAARRKSLSLSNVMGDDDLKRLLQLFVTDGERLMQNFPDIVNDVPGVSVSHYLHGDQPDEKCRDVRYKYDRHPAIPLEEFAAKEAFDPAHETVFCDLIKGSRHALGSFSVEELHDLASRIRSVAPACFEGFSYTHTAQRSGGLVPEAFLQALWRQEPGWDAEHVRNVQSN